MTTTEADESLPSKSITYYRGVQGLILVYDITNPSSFNKLNDWMSEIKEYAQGNVAIIILGNKKDLESSRKVSTAEGQELAKKFGAKYLEVSAKTATNVQSGFQQVSEFILETIK